MKNKKKLLSIILSITLFSTLIVYKVATVKASPISWDGYSDMGGIDQSIYSSEQTIMNSYNDSYTIKPANGEQPVFGTNDKYTDLTIDSVNKIMSKWYISGYGPMLDYATNNVNRAESISIDWNSLNNTYSNANYIYIGSNQADLAEEKSVAMMNYSSNSFLPVLVNSSSISLSTAVLNAVDSHNINNLVILGGGQRFSDLIGIGEKYNMVRIGGTDRNDTYNLLNTVESSNKSSFYNPTKPSTDSNGIVCDIPDGAFKFTDKAVINNYLTNGDFNSAVSYVLSISQGSQSNIQNFSYSALIGCGGKFLKVFYVNYKNGFSYGVYQYMGSSYFGGSSPPQPPVNSSVKATVTAPGTVIQGNYASISGTGTDTNNDVTLTSNFTFTPLNSLQLDNLDTTKTNEGNSISNNCRALFTTLGTIKVAHRVTDSNGASDTAYTTINVVPPYPVINILQAGTQTQNRKLTIDASSSNGGSSTTYINWTKAKWQVAPANGSSNNNLRIQTHTLGSTDGTILYDPSQNINNSLDGLKSFDITSKTPGTYIFTCTLTNNLGYSTTKNITVNISEDILPIANYASPSIGIRDPNDNDKAGYAQGTIPCTDDGTLANGSYSPDGDLIAQRAWFIIFDSNNNGSYADDTCYIYDLDYNGSNNLRTDDTHWHPLGKLSDINIDTIDITEYNTGNIQNFKFKGTHVGKYMTALRVREEFGQDYIPQFVTISDRKSSINDN